MFYKIVDHLQEKNLLQYFMRFEWAADDTILDDQTMTKLKGLLKTRVDHTPLVSCDLWQMENKKFNGLFA
jgi:hypothetical protein